MARFRQIGCMLALMGAFLVASTTTARAQVAVSVGNPWMGRGFSLGIPGYGYGYGYGYPYMGTGLYGTPMLGATTYSSGYSGYVAPGTTYFRSGYYGYPMGSVYSYSYPGYLGSYGYGSLYGYGFRGRRMFGGWW